MIARLVHVTKGVVFVCSPPPVIPLFVAIWVLYPMRLAMEQIAS